MPTIRRLLPLLLLALVAACAGNVSEEVPRNLDLPEAMAFLGKLVESRDGDAGQVAVIMDRHSAKPGFQRVRPQLRRIQREHRLLVAYLVEQGYGLLGCELPMGPLERDATTESEYRVIENRIRPVTELDEYGVYQPIRFQLLHRDRLRVHGVEDPVLYENDKELWKAHVRGLAAARRKDRPESERRAQLALADEARRGLDANVEARGRAAARNLAELMQAQERRKAILMLGGAHVPAALDEFRRLGLGYAVFKSELYDAPITEKDPEDD